ncbi:hypothetical protein [Paenibacillus algorifonticola]|nr:hypothetical protein [Paenibacillus algorifonticola]
MERNHAKSEQSLQQEQQNAENAKKRKGTSPTEAGFDKKLDGPNRPSV